MEEIKQQRGQAILESLIALGLIAVPILIMIGKTFQLDWEKTRCAFETFYQARLQMIRSQMTSESSNRCGKIVETVRVFSLEALSGDPTILSASSDVTEALQSWGPFSSWRPSPSASDSSEFEPPQSDASINKSPSIAPPDSSPPNFEL